MPWACPMLFITRPRDMETDIAVTQRDRLLRGITTTYFQSAKFLFSLTNRCQGSEGLAREYWENHDFQALLQCDGQVGKMIS